MSSCRRLHVMVWIVCLFMAGAYTRADTATLDIPEFLRTLSQGEGVEAFVDFGVDFSPLDSLTIEITATGTPGQDAGGEVPATLTVTATQVISDVIGDPWIEPTALGPFGTGATTDSVSQSPPVSDDGAYSGIWLITAQAPSIGLGLVTPAQIHIQSAKLTAVFDPIPRGCSSDINCDGFVGIADLNIVLSNWNQNVTPGDDLAGDLTDDGFVGIEDLNLVLGNWNAGIPPGNAVPEPAALACLGAGSTLILRRQWN